jgi:uncharacterized membrane protein
VHLGGDVAHLLAAGAWLGALPLVAAIFIRAARRQSQALDRIVVRTTQRFSAIGVACVGTLLVTGTINAWYLVATWAALFGTPYGQLLLLKLARFALMLAFAARNRLILMPRLQKAGRGTADPSRDAMRGIARNASIEAALGVAVVIIVGALGISIPGVHTEISWPLPFRLDPDSFAVVPAHPTTYARASSIRPLRSPPERRSITRIVPRVTVPTAGATSTRPRRSPSDRPISHRMRCTISPVTFFGGSRMESRARRCPASMIDCRRRRSGSS